MTRSAIDDPIITTFGRLVEAYSRLAGELGRDLETTSGLPLTWFEVLLRLARSPDGQLTMGQLATQLALTTGGMTRLVDRMIAAGLVEKRACPTDRRVTFAALTKTGRREVTNAARRHADALHETFASFTARDLRTLDGLLDRLRPDATR